jgi:hypothetical protein
MADRVEDPPLNLKGKGDLAELVVAADLRRRGFGVAIPFGEDHDFDLILIRPDRLERVRIADLLINLGFKKACDRSLRRRLSAA